MAQFVPSRAKKVMLFQKVHLQSANVAKTSASGTR